MPSLTSRRTGPGRRVPALIAAGNMFARRKFQIPLIAIMLAVAVMAAAASSGSPAHAQQVDQSLPPLADLTIASHIPGLQSDRWHVTVKNNTVGAHPGMQFRLVKVRITLWDPVRGTSTQMWNIRNLPPGGSAVRTVETLTNAPKATDEPQFVPQRLYAEIIESDPVELPRFRFNTATENWVIEDRHGGFPASGRTYYAIGDVALDVAISDRLPLAGGATTFTVAVLNDPAYLPRILTSSIPAATQYATVFDTQVEISLSPGLSFAATQPDAPSGTTFDTSTGIWNVGTIGRRDLDNALLLPVDVSLTAPSLTDLSLDERCLTVKVVRAVPWFGNDPLKRQNDTATTCLGKAVLTGGEIALFDFYPCISVTSYPCTSADTLELVVGRSVFLLQPEEVIVRVPDPGGRVYRNGTILWSTAEVMDLRISMTRLTSSWEVAEAVTVTAPGGGNAPGSWAIVSEGSDILRATGISKVAYEAYSLSGFGNDPADYQYVLDIEFSALGTYKALHEITGTLSGTTYGDSGTYTFHVGPVAELEVRDGGQSPAVPADQRAYSIMAVNNGPDDAPDAQVTVTNLNAGDYFSHTATAGSFNSTTGVWTIGELKNKDYYQGLYGRDGEVLTIITSAASAPDITATIANTQDYAVCIDSSGNDVAAASEAACTATSGNTWHTTEYYDYIPGNNRATIAARAGTGEGHPDAARGLRVMETRVGNILMWQPVKSVNGFRVSHYEVERWASRWTPLAGARGNLYFDMGRQSNTDYRVRAVNEFGHEGPWSITGRPPDAPGNFTVELSDSGNGAVLSWTEPASPSPITGYVIDISDSAEGDSRTNDATVAANVTTYTHTGLSPGDVKFYRVQARNRDGVGPWTEWQSVSSGPGAPGSLQARANGPSEIVLTWNEASSRDVTIYEYELEYSDTSASQGYEWTFLQTVLHDEGLRYVDNTVSHGTTRYYRVRGRTLQGNVGGAWSNVASATTPAAGPSPPLNVSADFAVGNTENGILLTWDAPASGDASYYRIEHSTDGATWESESNRHTGTCDVGGTTKFCYTDSGLFSGTEHWYRVAGVNSSGVPGEWSAPVSHITQGEPTDPPGEPQNLRITGVSGRQVSLAWDAPDEDGGTRVTGYEYMVEGPCVHAPEEICQVVKPTRTGGTTRTVTVPNFRGHYGFYVRALNAVGAGSYAQPVGQYINPQRNWRVSLSPSRLTVTEGGQATYTVRLTSDPGQPVWVALDWYGDTDLGEGHADRGIPSLSEQQFKWLLPSNYANRNPDIYLDPEYTAPWNTGVTITVTALEDDDSENGTLEVHNTVFYIPCADLGNPAGCVDDPEDTGVTAYLTVTERDND